MTHKKIIWLASYPKSGNTWLRILLTHYLKQKNENFDLNNLITEGIASNRNIFEEATGLHSSDLSHDEIDNLRPDVYRFIAENAEKQIFIKIHDANLTNANQQYLIPDDVTYGVIYLIRNPLDVAVSFAYHSAINIDKAVDFICDEKATFCSNNKILTLQLQQKLLSWSGHVQSWTEDTRFKLLIIRYEDLLKNTAIEFEKVIKFLNLAFDKQKLISSVNYSTFDVISKQEKENGFNEKPLHAESFFRKGKEGDWKNHLSNSQADKIRKKNTNIMTKFEYF